MEKIMSDKDITCPKCSHQQNSEAECESCGIIFAKHQLFLEKKKATAEAQEIPLPERKREVSGPSFTILILLLVLCTAATTYYFVKPRATAPPPTITASESRTVKPASTGKITRQELAPLTNLTTTDAIARALRATVQIRTAWSTGSGFFLTDSFIITNRHVVKAVKQDFSEQRRNINNTRKLVELEKQKIRNLHARLKKMAKGPGREQLKIIIAEHERQLALVLPKLSQKENELKNLEKAVTERGDIVVYMADGSKHTGYLTQVSDHYDLALLSIFSVEHGKIPLAPAGSKLQQGDKVYTIGSPVGLQNTVTAGIFSGYRRADDSKKIYLQTDAAINPGNSGGPLIDENGHIRGINTMVLKNTEGIGFAIPIEKVYEDFGSVLY
ncbi:related to serine proteinase [Desulfotalea psychrophila LSv54]|uniref:Related to serine proteinase n=2 Tax=Desulfotalea psychrophila TaxID=84980 RepID=Q6ARI8_DESPS|nr:related to serine proteinase [Desulfotalea psychrophila LSv54]